MKSARAIRAQVLTWLERAQDARDAVRHEVEGMNFPRVSDEVREDGLRRWGKLETTADCLSDVLSFIDEEPYYLAKRDERAADRR
jgi:hypothetical protein